MCLLILLLSPSATYAASASRQLTLPQAVSLALEQGRGVQQATEKLGEAGAARQAVRGNFGPKLSVEANLFFWNDEVRFEVQPPSPEMQQKHAAVFAKYPDLLTALPDLLAFGPIRETVTSSLSVSIAQPLTPLYTVYKGHKAAALGEEVARDGLAAARDAATLDATRAYLGLKAARRGIAIATGAVEQVETHLKRARLYFDTGMVGRNDVLKVELALAQARERVIQAQAAEAMAQSALAVTLGLPPEESLDPIDEFPDPTATPGKPVEDLSSEAQKRRPECRSMARQVEMAEAGRDIAWWALAPQVNALASYQHSEGMGFLLPKDSFFAGGVLRWDVWEWGAKYYGISEAEHRVRQAQIGAQQLADGVYLEAKKAFLDLKAAEQTILVARTAVALAEESFRLETARFEKNVNTTADVLDAQLALTRAEFSHSTALYQWYAARASLEKATGGATATPAAGQAPAAAQNSGPAAKILSTESGR